MYDKVVYLGGIIAFVLFVLSYVCYIYGESSGCGLLEKQLKKLKPISNSYFVLLLAISLFIVAGFLQTGVFHRYENNWNSLFEIYSPLNSQDDWGSYHKRALDIVKNGLLMPNASVPYGHPAGFLYVYFVALIYSLFGEGNPLIFLIQSAMMGGVVFFLYEAFSDRMSHTARVCYFSILVLYAMLDWQFWYPVELFSENLLLFFLALSFYLIERGYCRNRLGARIILFAVLGLMVLTRPNILIFPISFICWILFRFYLPQRKMGEFSLSVVVFCIFFSLHGLRNYLLTGQFIVFPYLEWYAIDAEHLNNFQAAPELYTGRGASSLVKLIITAFFIDPVTLSWYYLKKMLFLLGFPFLVDAELGFRGHWLVLWICFLMAVWCRIKGKLVLHLNFTALYLFVFTTFPVMVVVPVINNYAFRHTAWLIIPMVASALPPGKKESDSPAV